jgi:hypothetical protein
MQLRAELEQLLRQIPPVATRRHDTPENHAWLGRAATIIENWNPSKTSVLGGLLEQFHSRIAKDSSTAFQQIIDLLNQAQYDLDLRMKALKLE